MHGNATALGFIVFYDDFLNVTWSECAYNMHPIWVYFIMNRENISIMLDKLY